MLNYRDPALEAGVALQIVTIHHVEFNSALEGQYCNVKSYSPLKIVPVY